MSERWYSLGKYDGCGQDIVRRHSFRGDVGYTLSSVCFCSQKLEVMKRMMVDNGQLVIWNEVSMNRKNIS